MAAVRRAEVFMRPPVSPRHGYFVTDRRDHRAGHAVFNRVTGLKDSWAK